MAADVLGPSILVGGRYRLERQLGEGGMGVVWEAHDLQTRERVALKVLKTGGGEARRRFQREARAIAAVRHPSVVAMRDFLELGDGTLAIVMEHLEGETLRAVLLRERRLSLATLMGVLSPVLSALEAAHAAGIVHRDLKPDNIFLCPRDRGLRRVRILDFGVAKLTAREGLAAPSGVLTRTGDMLGTIFYMAPEQVIGEKTIDARADVWALGVIVYESLAGALPTQGDNVGRVVQRILSGDWAPLGSRCPDLPPDVADLVARMLAHEPEGRPRDARDVRAVLDRHRSRSALRVIAVIAIVAVVVVGAILSGALASRGH